MLAENVLFYSKAILIVIKSLPIIFIGIRVSIGLIDTIQWQNIDKTRLLMFLSKMILQHE